MHCMPVLSLVYFRNLALISETTKAKCLDVGIACRADTASAYLCRSSLTVSGTPTRRSEKWRQRQCPSRSKDFPVLTQLQNAQWLLALLTAIDGSGTEGEYLLRFDSSGLYGLHLQNRFAKEIRETTLPKRNVAPGQINPDYQSALVKMHGAVLGATAL